MQKEDISIIVVDDLQFSREVFKSGLKKAGYQDIRTAESGEEALFQLNQRRANIVLADFFMPNMNGLELTELIRKWDENNDRYTGVVLLTAEDTTASIVVAFDRGVDDFVSKSANQFEIAARVYGTARTAKQQNDLRDRSRQLSAQFQNIKQHSLIDKETGLENHQYLENQLNAMIQHTSSRGGGIGIGIVRICNHDGKTIPLRKGTLRTIANSMKIVTRPLDIVCRLDQNSFAIAVLFENKVAFNSEMFSRLIKNIKKRTREKDDTGKTLRFFSHLLLITEFNPLPAACDLLTFTLDKLSDES